MGLKEFGEKLFPKTIVDDYDYDPDNGVIDEEIHTPESSYSARSSTNMSVSTGSSIEMKVVTPKSYDTVTQIADLLLSKKTVLLNLESTNRETARRLIDFLSGVAYSIDGSLKKIATNAYVITPSNVNVGDAKLASRKAPEPAPAPVVEDFGEY